jgi:DNA-binding MarR family transcriptional regulator
VNDKQAENELSDPLERWLGYRLRRISAAAMADVGPMLAREGFTASLAAVLLMIEANPGRTQAQIGRALAIKRANIAPMIARLERDTLIVKESIDGRSFGLNITANGKKVAKKLAAVFSAHDDDLFGCLTNTEHTQLKALMEKIRVAHSARDSTV